MFVAEGATVVTNRMNREFYEKVVFSPAPRTLEPDRLSLLNPDQLPNPVMELVGGKYVISDGTRNARRLIRYRRSTTQRTW